MTNTDIIGGVSPFKRKSMRRGKSYGVGKRGAGDTRYKRDKWVKPASGGTTTKSSKPPNPKKPYTMTPDGKVKMTPPGDVNITEGDNIINQTSDGGYTTKTTKTKGKPATDDIYEDRTTMTTYQQAWDKNFKIDEDGNKIDKWGHTYSNDAKGFEKFKKATDEYNERTGHTTKKTEKVLVKEGEDATPDSETTTQTYVADEGNIANIYDDDEFNINSPNNMLGSPGKFRLGGYRAMKKNKK